MLMRIPWVVLELSGLMRLGCPWIWLRGRFVLLYPWVVGRLGRPWVVGRFALVRCLVACMGVLWLLSPWVGLGLILLMLPRVLSFNRAGGAGENCK